MSRPTSRFATSLRLARGVLGALFLLAAASTAWAASPVFLQGPNLGTYTQGPLQIPLAASGGDGAHYTWQLIGGTLPPGLSLRTDRETWFPPNASAGLMGVATAPGTYNFTLLVVSGAESSAQNATIKVSPLLIADYWYLPDAFLNASYRPYTFTALRNGLPVIGTWAPAGGLPSGMSVSAAGVLSGTPTVSGSYSVAVSFTDGIDTIFRTVSLSVFAIEITTPGLLPNATQNVPYHATLTAAGGAGGYTFSSSSGCSGDPRGPSTGLPSGLVLDPSSGQISGTVTTWLGLCWFDMTATDANHVSVTKRMSIDVIGDPPALPALANPFADGVSFCTVDWPCGIALWFAAGGGRAPFTWSATGLPAGLEVRQGEGIMPPWIAPGAAGIFGSPTASGTFNVTITLTDADGVNTSNTFPFYVSPLTQTASLANGTVGSPYSQQLRIVGGPSRPFPIGAAVSPQTLYSAVQTGGHLPAGLIFDPTTFTIRGTPAENGWFSGLFRFTDLAGGIFNLSIGLFIESAGTSTIQISTAYDLGTAFVGSLVSRTLSACCAPSYAWTLQPGSSLPPGVSLSSAGVISGTPTTTGTYQFMVRVADALFGSNFALRQFVLTVSPPTSFFVNNGFNLPFGNVGSPYGGPGGLLLTTSGGTGALTWTLAPNTFLPPGITLSPSGVLSGTPTSAGQYLFTVNVGDSAGHAASSGLTVSIYPAGAAPPLNLPLSTSFGPMGVGQFTVTLAATGGTAPYHYSLTPGAAVIPGMRVQDGQPLPTGFTASASYLGVITTPGVYQTSIRVTDSLGVTFDKAITVNVAAPITLSQFNLPKATVGVPYSFTLVPYGGSGVYFWSVTSFSALPPGLTLNSATGQISGTPTTAGNFFPNIVLTDFVTPIPPGLSYTLTVDPFAITTGGVLPSGSVGVPYSQAFSAPGCGAGCSWSIPGAPPAGLTFSPAGVLSGMPTFSTTAAFTVQASGGTGTVQKVFSIAIAASTSQPLTIATSSVIGPTIVGGLASTALFATGGVAPYVFSLHAGSSLPQGISLVSPGELFASFFGPGFTYLSGRGMQVGVYTFTIDVTDAVNNTASRTFTWNISALSNQYFSLPLAGSSLVYNVPYSQPLLVIGGTGNYTWTATGPMPPGLTLNPATGVVSGTPANTGSFIVPIAVADDAGNSTTATLFFNVGGPTATTLNIPLGSPLTLSQGSSATFVVTPTGGTGPYTVSALTPLPPGFALEAGSALPAGIAAGSIVLQGTGFTPGVFTFTLQAQDSAGNIGVRSSTLTVLPMAILSTTLADASVGVAYSQALSVLASAGPVTWTVAAGSALPPGMTLSPAGVIGGTPAAAGTFTFTLTGTTAAGSLNVLFPLRVSNVAILDASAILPVGIVGQSYSYTFNGSAGSLVWSATGLPPGLTLSASGVLSGTPTTAGGPFSLAVTATNGVVPVSRQFTLYTRLANPTILNLPLTSTALADATVGQRIQTTFFPSGGRPPYTWSVAPGSALPPGLQLISGPALPPPFSPGFVLLTGIAAAEGAYSFDLVITDSAGAQIRRTFTLNVSSIGLVTTSVATGTTGSPYATRFTAVGGSGAYTFSMTPSSPSLDMLPPGFSLSSDGMLSGTTTSTGNYSFVLHVQDSAGHTFARAFSLVINNPLGLRITSANPADTSLGRRGLLVLSTSGTSIYTWSVVAGSLPPGMTLTSFSGLTVLGGPPSATGTFNFTVRATDTANPANTADHAFTWHVGSVQLVSPPIELTVLDLMPTGHVGSSYSFTFKAAGGTPPYTFAESPFNPLPAGLSLGAGGVLSGTPEQAGSYTLQPIVADSTGDFVNVGPLALFIAPAGAAVPLVTHSTLLSPSGASSLGLPFVSSPLDPSLVSGGAPPFSWSIRPGSSLPPGLALRSGSGGAPSYVAGIPSAAGSYSTDLVVADSAGQTLTTTVTMTVSPLALTPGAAVPGIVGVPYSLFFIPSGGVSPYTVQFHPLSSLPPGLSFDGSLLSGVPTQPGNFAVAFNVGDAAGNTLPTFYRITIDNAAGQAPAVSVAPNPIQIYYEIGSPSPAPASVSIAATSGALAFNLALMGVPGASLTSTAGTAPASTSLAFDLSGVAPGTYVGVLGAVAPGSTNVFDAAPVVVTVATPPPCSFVVTPVNGIAPAAGGSGSFGVETRSTCSWTATASDPWISITSPATGTGVAKLSYSIAANVAASQRSGSISVNGAAYAITQFGTQCSFAITPSSLSAPAGGGTATIALAASSAACTWTASGLDATPAGGTGSGTVTIAVSPNTSAASRVLTAVIGGQTLTVNQAGVGCGVTLSPYSASAPAAGGTGSVGVTVPSGCSYSTASTPSWISVTSGGSGGASGSLVYSVAPSSTTVARSGTVMIGGQPFVITQDALACSVTVDTSGLGSPFGTTGGAGIVGVTTNAPTCSWSASSGVPWASLTRTSGTGSGTVGVTVSSNAGSSSARPGTLTIAGQAINVSQNGMACAYALQSATGAVPGSGGSGSVGVIAASACTWTAVTNTPAWLTITSAGSAGSSDVQFVAAPNTTSSPRTGTLAIAGQTYTVTQAAAPCSVTLGASGINVSQGGVASASLAVPTLTSSCSPSPGPSVVSYVNWIAVTGASFGPSSGTVQYAVGPNASAMTRVGTIQVADRTFTIAQSAAPCGYSLHSYGAVFDNYTGSNAGKVFGSPSAAGCIPTNGTTQPSWLKLGTLTGPDSDIFTQNYSVAPWLSLTGDFSRTGQIVFGGQLFTVKQKSGPLNGTACGATDVSSLVSVGAGIRQPGGDVFGQTFTQELTLNNHSTQQIAGPLYLVLHNLPTNGFTIDKALTVIGPTPLMTQCFSSRITRFRFAQVQGDYLLFLGPGPLQPNQVLHQTIGYLTDPGGPTPGGVSASVLSGQAPSR